ncbi:S16 family serine protease [Fredinandcohnia sp. QZ13]|uniref:S16 family serine protease n=1 Tax=Fredinandcohnia sp. QZ13 TaxID=3073144 RepID=UPI0028534913|nr:S16 family serine protease [Fredinandcohnia sp. QZ13]MDR4889669.1 S16 family serine protease [Fredinandcohnia sp. QZ13]
MRKPFIFTGVALLLIYATLWVLYYFDFISAFWLIGVLGVELVLLLILLIIFRNKKSGLMIIQITAVLLIGIFVFELKLVYYESFSYRVSLVADPIEAVEHSGIHLLVVNTFDLEYPKDEEYIIKGFENDNQEVLNLYKINNENRYKSKNAELLNWIINKEEDFSIMRENVQSYLSGDTTSIDAFLKRDDISGDSVGLGLAISAKIADGKLKNNKTIGITGALDASGNVLPIGMIEEKIRIAEKKSYPYIIVPDGNAKEAREVKQTMNLKIEIFDVNHIDQAVSLIKRLNTDREKQENSL